MNQKELAQHLQHSNRFSKDERKEILSQFNICEKLSADGDLYFKENADEQAAVTFKKCCSLLQKDPLKHLLLLDITRAKWNQDLANALYRSGDKTGAIEQYKYAQSLYGTEYCKDRTELDSDRAKIAVNLARALIQISDYTEATHQCNLAQTLYQNEYCRNREELDPGRARIAMILAAVLGHAGDWDGTIEQSKRAQTIHKSNYCHGRHELDPDRAIAATTLATAFRQTGDLTAAIEQYKYAEALYQGEFCKNRTDLDIGRANTAINMANAIALTGDQNGAIEQLQHALALYEGDYCRDRSELDLDRAKVTASLATVLQVTGDFTAAVEQYRNAQTLLKGDFCSTKPELDPIRAQTAAGLAIALGKIGNQKDAIKLFQQAQTLHQSDYCQDRVELDPDRSNIAMNLANIFNELGDHTSAIEQYKNARALLQSDFCRNRPELDTHRANISTNLAITLSDIGYKAEAIKEFHNVDALLQSNACGNRPELDPNRANLATSLANTLKQTGDHAGAIDQYRYAQTLYQADFCRSRPELDPGRASTALNLANVLKQIGDHTGAIEQYTLAQAINHGKFCWRQPELDSSRANTVISLADYSLQNGDITSAIEQYKHALNLLNGDYCKDRAPLDPIRAIASMQLAVVLLATSSYAKGFELIQYTFDLWENKIKSYSLPLNLQRFRCYATASSFLAHIPDSQSWVFDKSQLMVRMLELVPDQGTAGTLEHSWQSIRNHFTRFHQNWLKYCVETGDHEFIPKILFAIQGRELATEVLDQWPDQNFSDLPITIKKYIQIRKDLRNMVQRSHSGKDISDVDSSPTHMHSLTGQENTPPYDDQCAFSSSETYSEKFDTERYNALHIELGIIREAVTKIPGYDNIFPDPERFNLHALQSNTSLTNKQALLLMIQLGNQLGLLLIRKNGKPDWINGDNFPEILNAVERLHLTCEQGNMRGTYRRIAREKAPVTDITKDVIRERPLNAAKLNSFWPQMIGVITTEFWKPLLPYLNGIEELIVLPQGDFHSFPLRAGKPSNLKLKFYPGLIFYVLKHGMIMPEGSSDNENETSFHLGLLHYSAKGVDDLYLPGVDKEIDRIEKLYTEQHQNDQSTSININNIKLLNAPNPYPQSPLSLDVLHFAGHGSVDPSDCHSTTLLVGGGGNEQEKRMLGIYDILTGKAKVKHVYIGACTAGRILDNSQGTPLGITTSLLRKGTSSITAALMPIDDDLASQFGYLWHTERLASRESATASELLERTQLALLKYYIEEYVPSLRDYWIENMKNDFSNTRTLNRLKDTHINQLCESLGLNNQQIAQFRVAEKDICGIKEGLIPKLRSIFQKMGLTKLGAKATPSPLKVSPQAKSSHMIATLDEMGCFDVDIRPQGRIPVELGIMLYCYRVYGD